MPDTFSTSGDQATQTNDQGGQGSDFSDSNTGDNQSSNTGVDNATITTEALAALTKREEHAQTHIITLETETSDLRTQMAEMQGKLDQAANVEDLLAQQGQSTVNADDVTVTVVQQVKDALKLEKVEELEDDNFTVVQEALNIQFGNERVDDAVKLACSENDMTWDEMVTLSRKNPKLALKLCNIEMKADQQPTSQSINTSALVDNYQQQEAPTKVNIMELRTDSARIANYENRLEQKLQELNKN